MQDIALISRKIYTAGTNFTRPAVETVATNLNSAIYQLYVFSARCFLPKIISAKGRGVGKAQWFTMGVEALVAPFWVNGKNS